MNTFLITHPCRDAPCTYCESSTKHDSDQINTSTNHQHIALSNPLLEGRAAAVPSQAYDVIARFGPLELYVSPIGRAS